MQFYAPKQKLRIIRRNFELSAFLFYIKKVGSRLPH